MGCEVDRANIFFIKIRNRKKLPMFSHLKKMDLKIPMYLIFFFILPYAGRLSQIFDIKLIIFFNLKKYCFIIFFYLYQN